MKTPGCVGVPLIVIVFEDQDAVTPNGKPVAAPIPVALVVVCVIGVNAELTHSEVVTCPVTVLIGLTLNVTKVDCGQTPLVITSYLIIVLPVEVEVTKPVEGLTVATDVFELLQVPPTVAFVNWDVAPIQISVLPIIVETPIASFTVMSVVTVDEQFKFFNV